MMHVTLLHGTTMAQVERLQKAATVEWPRLHLTTDLERAWDYAGAKAREEGGAKKRGVRKGGVKKAGVPVVLTFRLHDLYREGLLYPNSDWYEFNEGAGTWHQSLEECGNVEWAGSLTNVPFTLIHT